RAQRRFSSMVDFIEASPLRIETTEEGTKILATAKGEGSSTPTEPHQTPSPEAPSPSHTTHTSPSLPPVTTTSIPTDRETIDKSSTLPHDSAPQEVEIYRLKERVKLLEEREGLASKSSGDDTPIKERSMDKGEAATKRVSDDTKEMAIVLTSMDATTVLASGVVDVPTASIIAEGLVPTGSEEVPTASLVFTTATVVTPVTRRKGKEVMVEFETLKKQKVQEQIDAQKTSEEVTEEAKPPEEVTEEKVKEMMQLVPIEEVYVEALQVKHHIINWKVYHEGQRSYWKITRLGETLSNRPPTSEKEMELWVELNMMYEPDKEDQLWTHTQNFMHAPVAWKLYDSCGVHHVTSKDKEIFMLVEKDYPLRKGLAFVMICYKL
nr:hypothetical protein [Tanacetum cinerariifolium]